MNPLIGWALALVLLAAGWKLYGLQGVVLALTVIAFWLMLQFSRVMRVMKDAGSSPIGHVGSAVMFNTKLRAGMPMVKVVTLTQSLGRKIDASPDHSAEETWAWQDDGEVEVHVVFRNGRVVSWLLRRPDEPAAA